MSAVKHTIELFYRTSFRVPSTRRRLLKCITTMATDQIFIAFTGPPVNQPDPIYKMADGFECWNLKQFEFDHFIAAIKSRITPIGQNVLGNYKRGPDANAAFGITEAEYTRSSWGVVLPDVAPHSAASGYAEALFVLNLFSPYFLFPVFFVTDLGIDRPDHRRHPLLDFHEQNQAHSFRREAFVQFYNALISESIYGSWRTDTMAKWNLEDWRLFTACLLFNELKAYQGSKEVFTWQRESANMATILEALFTAGGGDNTEVGYKLRKRAAALLGFRLPNIEKEINDLYEQRSSFVHGSFFLKFRKSIKVEEGLAKLPSPPFELLYRQKENIRRALIAYLHLSKIHRSNGDQFGDSKSVMDILERSIIDTELRAKVSVHVESILSLLD